MVREDLAGLPDGSTLRTTDAGLEIVRRKKHEPIDLQGFGKKELKDQTDRKNGSKFLANWTLEVLVNWIDDELEVLKWSEKDQDCCFDDKLTEVVGISNGKEVHTIRIVKSGRWVHAYPVEDAKK